LHLHNICRGEYYPNSALNLIFRPSKNAWGDFQLIPSHKRFGVLTPTQYPCCSWERLWVVADLQRRYRNIWNEGMKGHLNVSETTTMWEIMIWSYSFIHSFIHYKDLCSTSSRRTTRKCSQRQHGCITQIGVVEEVIESRFWEVIREPRRDEFTQQPFLHTNATKQLDTARIKLSQQPLKLIKCAKWSSSFHQWII